MRILYVSHTHPPKGTILNNVGGMQRVSRQLIDELHKSDDIDVLTQAVNVAGDGSIALQTIAFLVKSLLSLPRKSREFDADVILFSSMVTASLAYFIRNRVNVPMVTINHGRDVTLETTIYQKFIPRVFDALDGVISVSRATREECIKRGMKPEKGVALSNGFNPSTMSNLPAKEASKSRLQQKFGIPLDDKKLLLTVGRKVKRKGHEWFIREVLPKIDSDVVYVTIGDGPELNNIKKAADESPLREKIFLLGRQPDEVLNQAYAAADLFVMPNVPVEGDMEGFGIVLLEANMAQTPAVASDLEGIKDVITSGQNGYKVPALNPEEFAGTIDKVLREDLKQLSEQTRDFVEQEFTWQQVARNYAKFLQQVIDRYSTIRSKK